jgi:hypothetical protein
MQPEAIQEIAEVKSVQLQHEGAPTELQLAIYQF